MTAPAPELVRSRNDVGQEVITAAGPAASLPFASRLGSWQCAASAAGRCKGAPDTNTTVLCSLDPGILIPPLFFPFAAPITHPSPSFFPWARSQHRPHQTRFRWPVQPSPARHGPFPPLRYDARDALAPQRITSHGIALRSSSGN